MLQPCGFLVTLPYLPVGSVGAGITIAHRVDLLLLFRPFLSAPLISTVFPEK